MDIQLDEFYKRASQISSNPFERISENTKKIIKKGNYIVDCHCHIFPRTTLNLEYILKRLPDFLDLILKDGSNLDFEGVKKKVCRGLWWLEIIRPNAISDEDERLIAEYGECRNLFNILSNEEKEKAEKLIEDTLDLIELDGFMIASAEERKLKKIAKLVKVLILVLRILKFKDIEDVYGYYKGNFLLSDVEAIKNKNYDTIIVAPMMDIESGWKTPVDIPFEQVVQKFRNLINEEPILPFFAVDPSRKNLYEEFLNAFLPKEDGTTPFYGLKVYPALGYLPSDHRLLPIYKVCAEKNIPVMTHCGGSMINAMKESLELYPFDINKYNYSSGAFPIGEKQMVTGKVTEIADYLNHPKRWEDVLRAVPNFKINLAHFGGSSSWEEYPATKGDEKEGNRIDQVIEFMKNYQVYADFSFNLIEGGKVNQNFKKMMESNSLVRERALFGTDFWVVSPIRDLEKMQDIFIKMFADHFSDLAITNPNKFLGIG